MDTRIRDDGTILILAEDSGMPVAEMVGDCLVIKSRHHGRKQTTVIPVRRLVELVGGRSCDCAEPLRN